MRVAVFGGSFNPPHLGHAMVAAWIRWADRADAVWLVPTFHHAFDKPLAPFDQRVSACRVLAEMIGPFVAVSAIEASLPRPSYTINTLRALQAGSPKSTFQLVLGADNLPQVGAWKEWPVIETEFTPIVVGRGSSLIEAAPSFPDISSTEVRRRVAQGLPVDHLVPAAVVAAWQGDKRY